jgi:uncharacterized protein
MIRGLAALVVALCAAECERTPPEDVSVRQSATVVSGSPVASSTASPPVDPLPSARCIRPTPAEAPPPAPPGPAAGCPADPERGNPKVPVVKVTFPAAGGATVDAELVRSEHDAMRGLMYRQRLGAGSGMLFDLHSRDDHRFWMHNTCIPLDLLFIDEDGLLVGIVENAPTLDDTSRGVDCPSRYVLEVNAGWTRKHGVKAGSSVKLPERRTTLIIPDGAGSQ